MTAAIEARGLTKWFRPVKGLFGRGEPKMAVAEVDLDVAEGELFALVGRNGAGKTTLVKLFTTLLLPSRGHAAIHGADVDRDHAAVRRLIGFASAEERSFYWRLSGRENLEFFASLHHVHGQSRRERIEDLISRLELDDFIDRRFDTYSSGMKQRVALARGLLGRPRVLFLDEPTRSLDPAAQKHTRALIADLKRSGITIVLVTHQLDEARELGDRIGFMADGRLRTFARGEVDLGSLF